MNGPEIPNPNTITIVIPGIITDGKDMIKLTKITVRATNDVNGKSISFSDERTAMIHISYKHLQKLIPFLEA